MSAPPRATPTLAEMNDLMLNHQTSYGLRLIPSDLFTPETSSNLTPSKEVQVALEQAADLCPTDRLVDLGQCAPFHGAADGLGATPDACRPRRRQLPRPPLPLPAVQGSVPVPALCAPHVAKKHPGGSSAHACHAPIGAPGGCRGFVSPPVFNDLRITNLAISI
eukprot:gene5539-5520_t